MASELRIESVPTHPPGTLELEGIAVDYGTGRHRFRAIEGVNLHIRPGATVGLVGESGSGKSTVARAVVGLEHLSAGSVRYDGSVVASAGTAYRRSGAIQMVFQDAHSSLNPRMTIGETLDEAIGSSGRISRGQRAQEAARLLELVAMDPAVRERFPHQFSGGQLQRIAIARALATDPRLIILDEVTSALDVSIQATILELLRHLQDTLGVGYLLISHDLAVVRHIAETIAIMYLGQIVERAETDAIFATPAHPYTRALLDSIPAVGKRRDGPPPARGDVPDPNNPPSGCRFHTRCIVGPLTNPDRQVCRTSDPHEAATESDQFVACHFPLREAGAGRDGR